MTVGEWLGSRSPRPPAALSGRLQTVLADSLGAPAIGACDVFIAAAERLVAELLRADNTSRHSALDLLTADALMTYAFEAAGGDVATIDDRASAAMTRIAALGGAEPARG